MSLQSQLKNLATSISANYSVDGVHRKSLVYTNPQSIDGQTCYHDCIKSFEKLCEVDPELKRFSQTLFSTGTSKMELSTLLPIHKTKVDEQIALFLFMINTHIRSSEASWSLEWLIYKFQIHLNHVDKFIMLLLPHYETGLFAKGIQLLDFRQSASQWQWLQPFAERGSPLTRMDFLKACTTQPTLIPFIGSFISLYIKYEVALSSNRTQVASSFFVSTISGLCDSGLSDARLAKLVTALQGVIRKGLRSPELPSFQSAASLAAIRISLKLRLNHDLVLDWIGCLLKKIRNGAEWESIRLVNILMRTQRIAILTDNLSDLHQNVLNSLSPIERALMENEENKSLEGIDLNQVALDSLQTSDRVQHATLMMDMNQSESKPATNIVISTAKKHNCSLKKLAKMHYAELFKNDKEIQGSLKRIHATLASEPNQFCIMQTFNEQCSCPNTSEGDDLWLANFVQMVAFKISENEKDGCDEKERKYADAFKVKQAEVALQMISYSFDACVPTINSPNVRSSTSSFPGSKRHLIMRALDAAFPYLLVILLHQNGGIRSNAYNLIGRFIALFAKDHSSESKNVHQFLSDCTEAPDCLSNLLQGDSLFSLVRTAPVFVRAVFKTICRQPLEDVDSLSTRTFWFAAVNLLHPDLLDSVISLGAQQSPSNKIGWPALLHIIRTPSYGRIHMTCLEHFDALTLLKLHNNHLKTEKVVGIRANNAKSSASLIGVFGYEMELLDALLELAGKPTGSGDTDLQALFSRLLLKSEHFVYCLAKLDPVLLRDSSKSLFSRVVKARNKKGMQVLESADGAFSLERARLRALKVVLSVASGDASRLQSDAVPSQLCDNTPSNPLFSDKFDTPVKASGDGIQSTPLSSAVSRLRNKNRRKSSTPGGRNSDSSGGIHSGSMAVSNENSRDLVFPLNNHLLACLSAESRFESKSSQRTRTASGCSSSSLSESDEDNKVKEEDEDEGVQDVEMKSSLIPLSDDEIEDTQKSVIPMTIVETASLREQNSSCAFEILVCFTRLFAEANRRKKSPTYQSNTSTFSKTTHDIENPLIPTISVTMAMDTIFHCLSVYKQTTSIQRQVILCLIEMASLFPVILCRNLVTLVQWVGSSGQFLKLDDIHNLSLLSRLISVAVPSLVQASKNSSDAALRVLTVFIRGLPDLPAHLPRRCLAVYSGLLRGLSQVAAPVTPAFNDDDSIAPVTKSPKSPGCQRRMTKQTSLQGWLWTTALIFLNTDWPAQETADLVFPLLIDLFNQFDINIQLLSWQQCLKVLLQLTQCNEMRLSKPAKRVHLETPILDKHQPDETMNAADVSLLLTYLSMSDGFNQEKDIESTPMQSSRKRQLSPAANKDGAVDGGLSADRLWRLICQTSGLFSSLLESSGHKKRREELTNRPGNLSETFSSVVKLVVRLLVQASAKASSEVNESARQVVHLMQSALVQLNDAVSSDVFLDSISRLMSLNQSSLTRKALELLQTKLDGLTSKCPSANVLLKLSGTVRKAAPQLVKLDETLERGLVNLANDLSQQLMGSGPLFSGDRTQAKLLHIRLSCLRALSQLLCGSHPTEMLKILDNFLEQPLRWWLCSSVNPSVPSRLASSAAETRSLICLFSLECLARLPSPLISLTSESKGAWHRVAQMLRFALDHANTAAQIYQSPAYLCNSEDNVDEFVSGRMHSREQHLQSALTLILGVLEFSTLGCSVSDGQESLSLLQRFRDSSRSTEQNNFLDTGLIAFVFRLTHRDLVSATQAKVERSACALKQVSTMVKRIRQHLISSSDSLHLLTVTNDLLKSHAEFGNDLVSGGLEFVARHIDQMRLSSPAVMGVDMDTIYTEPSSNVPNSIETTYSSKPALIWSLLRFALESRPFILSADDSSVNRKAVAGLSAAASLLSALNRDYRLQLVSQCLRWTVTDISDLPNMLLRLQSLFSVTEKLAVLIPPESFAYMVKNANLINLFVSCLYLLAGDYKSRNVKKLAAPMELPHFMDIFSSLNCSLPTHRDSAVACIRSALACTAAWLRVESQLTACLDTAGTDVVLALPQAIIGSLTVGSISRSDSGPPPPITETDLVPVVDAFLKAIGGDEALLRPFGVALCAQTGSGHWRSRLAALRLLKQTFDTLIEPDADNNGDLGLANCLVSDTLAALSEALEDNRPEVEAAANRLFADLEATKATTITNS